MRILIIGPWFSPHTTRPISWLLQAGHQVLFLGDRDPFPESGGAYSFQGFPGGDLGDIIGSLAEIRDRFRPDAVHVHWIDEKAWLCVKAGLAPLVLSAWGSDINQFYRPEHDVFKRRLIGEALASADLTIVDAPTMAEKCTELAGTAIATEFLHLGLDIGLFKPGYREQAAAWRRRLDIPADATVLLSPRGWGASNGHHRILEAFARALPECGSNTILLFKIFNSSSFGDNNSYEMELRRRAIELGVSGQLRWMGDVPADRLPEIFALSDITLNYPDQDTLPITLAESVACQCCAITVLLPSYRGTYVERHLRSFAPGDEDDLVRAMVEFVTMGTERRMCCVLPASREVRISLDDTLYREALPRLFARVSKGATPVCQEAALVA